MVYSSGAWYIESSLYLKISGNNNSYNYEKKINSIPLTIKTVPCVYIEVYIKPI